MDDSQELVRAIYSLSRTVSASLIVSSLIIAFALIYNRYKSIESEQEQRISELENKINCSTDDEDHPA